MANIVWIKPFKIKKKWIEVQIRSERMHEIAEKGYAAHYKYKVGKDHENGLENWLNRLKELLESKDSNAFDFVENFIYMIFNINLSFVLLLSFSFKINS